MAARLEPAVVPPHASRFPVAATLALGVTLGALLPALDGCRRNDPADDEAIRALVAKEVAAINARDLPGLSEIWSKDKEALLFDVPPPGRFQGWDQIGPVWKSFFEKVSDVHMTVDSVRATNDGSLGYATYDWAMTGRLGSYPLDDRGEATAIYRKQGGQWRLVHAHFSPAPPVLAGEPGRGAPPGAGGSGAAPAGGAAQGSAPPEKPGGAGAGKPANAGPDKPVPMPTTAPAAGPAPRRPRARTRS